MTTETTISGATQRLIDLYKETREEVWITQAAINCMGTDEPLPSGIHSYILKLLFDREKSLSITLKKRHTKQLEEWYIREVRDLMFLTGTDDPEDACHRVSNVNTLLYGNKEKVPAGTTLFKLWNNRYSSKRNYHCADQWRSDPAVKVSYEKAKGLFGEYCKAKHSKRHTGEGPGVELKIKRNLFD